MESEVYGMVYDYKVVQDGRTYQPGEDVPDLGSITCTSTDGNIRNYEGLLADVPKLMAATMTEKYKDLETGSSITCSDTPEIYKYVKETRTWYKW